MSKERGEKMKVLYVVVPCYNEEEDDILRLIGESQRNADVAALVGVSGSFAVFKIAVLAIFKRHDASAFIFVILCHLVGLPVEVADDIVERLLCGKQLPERYLPAAGQQERASQNQIPCLASEFQQEYLSPLLQSC